MPVTITLKPDIEKRFVAEANDAGLSLDEWTARRLQETDVLWRIRTAAPESETQELHRLLRQRDAGKITSTGKERLQSLLIGREERAAKRLEDLIILSRLRGVSVRDLMNQLGIAPIPAL